MRWMILTGCLALAVASTAAAQPRPRAEPAVNAELIRLHDDLHLSDNQETDWRAYTLAIAADPQTAARRRATTELLPLVPTPRRIALIQASMAQDEADFRRQGAAVTAFTAS